MFHHFRHHHRQHDEAEPGLSFIGRHRGRGRFAGGFMSGDGLGGHGFRTGRKLASGELQLLVLSLLADKPSHGYEIIKALEERSGGFYVPSPGMVYPALTYLEEIGHATVQAEGSKKLYSITAEGRAFLEQNDPVVKAILQQLERIGSRMDTVRRAFSGEAAVDEEEGAGPLSGLRGHKEAWLARHELKAALHEKKHSSPEEYLRIAAILRRAAEEIRRK
jgi:DNA-binding PadR family transcriptional regulator